MTWYLLWCLECTPPDDAGGAPEDCELPFTTPEARGRWASKHRSSTGHDRWWVIDVPATIAS